MDQEKLPIAKSGYGKRPLWQWVLIYLIVGGAVYAAIYYFMGHKSASGYGAKTNSQVTQPAAPGAAGAAKTQAPAGDMSPAPTQSRSTGGGYMW